MYGTPASFYRRPAFRKGQSSSGGLKIIDTQTFTANGTWTKPQGAVQVEVICVGGGGAGSGGVVTGNGGGGGGGGTIVRRTFVATSLGATESITVGAATSTTAANTAGASGNYSAFGSWVEAAGGLTSGVAANGGTSLAHNIQHPFAAAPGSATNRTPIGNGGNGAVIPSGGGIGLQNYTASGGGGGAADTGTVGAAGGALALYRGSTNVGGGGTAGASGGGAGGAGPAGSALSGVGGGGGGGGGTGATTGGAGGAGGAPGGGGGGGGSGSTTGGTGGAGARGEVAVITWG